MNLESIQTPQKTAPIPSTHLAFVTAFVPLLDEPNVENPVVGALRAHDAEPLISTVCVEPRGQDVVVTPADPRHLKVDC